MGKSSQLAVRLILTVSVGLGKIGFIHRSQHTALANLQKWNFLIHILPLTGSDILSYSYWTSYCSPASWLQRNTFEIYPNPLSVHSNPVKIFYNWKQMENKVERLLKVNTEIKCTTVSPSIWPSFIISDKVVLGCWEMLGKFQSNLCLCSDWWLVQYLLINHCV